MWRRWSRNTPPALQCGIARRAAGELPYLAAARLLSWQACHARGPSHGVFQGLVQIGSCTSRDETDHGRESLVHWRLLHPHAREGHTIMSCVSAAELVRAAAG